MAKHRPPMLGRKLVATGPSGEITIATPHTYRAHTMFGLVNYDCVGKINLLRLALIRMDGRVIYDGPPVELVRDPATQEVINEVPVAELAPHTGFSILTKDFMKDPDAADPNRWLKPLESLKLPLASYTLEVNWAASRLCVPLTGWMMRYTVDVATGEQVGGDRTLMPEVIQRLRR